MHSQAIRLIINKCKAHMILRKNSVKHDFSIAIFVNLPFQ